VSSPLGDPRLRLRHGPDLSLALLLEPVELEERKRRPGAGRSAARRGASLTESPATSDPHPRVLGGRATIRRRGCR
jgi:hypothetical protein